MPLTEESNMAEDGVEDDVGVTSNSNDEAVELPTERPANAPRTQYKPRQKRRSKPLSEEMAAAAARAAAMNVWTVFPSFGYELFETFEEFDAAWEAYCKRNYGWYHFRHSLTRDAKNRKLSASHAARRTATDQPLHLIPRHLTYFIKNAWCTHGCTQETRGNGERYQAATRYTGCPARLSAEAQRDPTTGRWRVVILNENTEHNHTCDDTVYNAYERSSIIDDSVLFKEAVAMLEVNGNPKLICDLISRRTGRHFTNRMLENFKQYRLGGGSALESLKNLLNKFAAQDGAQCLVIDDEDGVTVRCFNDKDLTEWIALKEVFPSSDVVLCQFHVLKWFKLVVTAPKYRMTDAQSTNVVQILRAMVYAVSDDDFAHQQMLLTETLPLPKFKLFHDYMNAQWYSCIPMWSYAGRGKIFTSANTTTNRVESRWKHYKATLGGKQRIDVCVEKIFVHGTAVLRREKELYDDYVTKTKLHPHVDSFVRPMLCELSDYAADLVKVQWHKYVAGGKFELGRRVSNKLTVRVNGVRSFEVEVDSADWSCTCHFHLSSGLPCRHALFAAREVISRDNSAFDVRALIPRRWSMRDAAMLLPELDRAIEDASTLRLSNATLSASADAVTTMAPEAPNGDAFSPHRQPPPRLTRRGCVHVQLRRNEVCDAIVLNDIEKRNIANSIFASILQYLMAQGTIRFRACADELENVLVTLLAEWRGTEAPKVDEQTADADEDDIDKDEDMDMDMFPISSGACSDDFVTEEEVVETACKSGIDSGLEYQCELTNIPSMPEDRSSEVDLGAYASASFIGSALQDVVADAAIRSRHNHHAGTLEELITAIDDTTTNPHDIRIPSELGGLMTPPGASLQSRIAQPRRARAIPDPTLTDTPSRNTRGAKRKALSSTETVLSEPGVLDKMKLPGPLKTGATKQTRQLYTATGREQPMNQRHDCPVFVDDFVVAIDHGTLPDAVRLHAQYPLLYDDSSLRNKSAVVRVYKVNQQQFRFNFSVPSNVLQTVKTAIDLRRQKDKAEGKNQHFGLPTTLDQYVASLAAIRGFSEQTVHSLEEFASRGEVLKAYVLDMQWATTPSNWKIPVSASPVPFLQAEADQLEGATHSLQTAKMRYEIAAHLELCTLKTLLKIPSSERVASTGGRRQTRVKVGRLFGGLARSEKLNDVAVNFGLQMLASRFDDDVIIHSLNMKKLVLPTTRFKAARVVVFPLIYGADNRGRGHWCIAVVVTKPGEHRTCHEYDPTASVWEAKVVGTWHSWCLPLLEAWFERDERIGGAVVDLANDPNDCKKLGPMELVYAKKPVQRDSVSCGLYCVAQAYAFMTERLDIQTFSTLSGFQMKMIRLRLLWLLACKTIRVGDASLENTAAETTKAFTRYHLDTVAPTSQRPRKKTRKPVEV